jgi:hypothetical protein
MQHDMHHVSLTFTSPDTRRSRSNRVKHSPAVLNVTATKRVVKCTQYTEHSDRKVTEYIHDEYCNVLLIPTVNNTGRLTDPRKYAPLSPR